MRSALLALLPRLAGLCRFDELFAMVFEVFDFEAEVAPEVDFDFVLPAVPVLPLEDFFFAEAERVAEDF